ncbi:MAG: DUF3500 domain-containing protein [Pirellulales bacterium]
MKRQQTAACPECHEFDRRGFLGSLGKGALVAGGLAPAAHLAARADEAPAKLEKPAEAMIKELYGTLSDEQKQTLVMPWNHGADSGLATRLKMVNSPHGSREIGKSYTKPQQELCHQIFKAICSDDEGYRRISRNGTFDGSGSFEGIGAMIFGEPAADKPYALVFSGHHLTIRCDGNSEPGAAFGGPMYYGDSEDGYSADNVFNYQTKSVRGVFDALNGDQRAKAVITGQTPGEQYNSVKFREQGQAYPGVGFAELGEDQKQLVEQVMRDILSPYRSEDADEVMQVIKTNGGLDQMHLAFYQDAKMNDDNKWHFWRIEGPGFVWNYRVLPHVHTFVNISSKTA